MEATIRIEDKTTFHALVDFLKSLNLEVITKDKRERDTSQNNWRILEETVAPFRKGLPDNYKFNREEAHER